MKCPTCNTDNWKVTDTRARENQISRRRKCLTCNARVSTIEIIGVDESKARRDLTNILNSLKRLANLRGEVSDLEADILKECSRG